MIEKKVVTTEETITEQEDGNEREESGFFAPSVPDILDADGQYRQLMYVHEAALEMILARINILKGEFQFSNDRNPIDHVTSRVKSQKSIVAKMQKKGLPMTVSALMANIHDIAGVRIVCPFLEDVYSVARMLVRQRGIDVQEVKDYIRNPKENGYRSLHMILLVDVEFSEGVIRVPVEVQIRTIAMNFWAGTEHQLRYKKTREFTDEDQAKLRECADIMAKADKMMQEIAGDFDLDMEAW